EVFIPKTVSVQGAKCIVESLTNAAHDVANASIPTGEDEPQIGDVTFFYLPKEELQAGLLNINLPVVQIGSDPFGDYGLGRQTLLLSKILLEGEYVQDVPGIN